MSPGDTAHRLVGGRYTLLEPLGQGGMGTVWRALDELLRRQVAVKQVSLPPAVQGTDPPATRERVIREARAAARLSHPSSVTVFDVLEDDGHVHIVMELLDADTLADAVEAGGPLGVEEAARVGLELVGALDAAHRRGIVHRDVKPGNVMLLRGGGVKLTDFGIATVHDDPRLTGTGQVVGSPSYMAPEQAMGGEVGPAADWWGLGASLYYAVEGRPPFERNGALPTLTAVVNDDPEPPARAGALAPLLARLLAKDPALRPDGSELRARLRELADGPPPPGPERERALARPWTDAGPQPARTAAGPAAAVPSPERERAAEPAGPWTDVDAEPPRPAARPATAAPSPEREQASEPAGPWTDVDAKPPRPAAVPATAVPSRERERELAQSWTDVDPEPARPAAGRAGPASPERERAPELAGPWTDVDPEPAGPAAERAGRATAVPSPGRERASPDVDAAAGRAGPVAANGAGPGSAVSGPGTSGGRSAARARSGAPAMRRSSRRGLVVAAAFVALALAAVVVAWSASRDGTGGTASPDGPGTTAPGTSTTAPGGVPGDWVTYTDPKVGYRIAHPPGWQVRPLDGTRTDIRDPETGSYLRVDWTDTPGPSPEGAWASLSRSFGARHEAYEEIRIDPTTYKGFDAALWEYAYTSRGARLHAVNLGMVTGRYGFALNFQTDERRWSESQAQFEAFKASFQVPA